MLPNNIMNHQKIQTQTNNKQKEYQEPEHIPKHGNKTEKKQFFLHTASITHKINRTKVERYSHIASYCNIFHAMEKTKCEEKMTANM